MRVMVYDRTCVRTRGHLTPVWATGGALYRGLGRIDAAHGVASWDEALAWIAAQEAPITEIQYWGHGTWGGAWVGTDLLDANVFRETHRLHAGLVAARARLAPDALVWFRCCHTLGARAGIDWAERLAEFLGARVAGHTYVIGFHQSGLHGVAPGVRADWTADEGLSEGTVDAPLRARSSRPWAPRTITALHGEVPAAWFAAR
jgi:hypothetical protein